MKAWMTISTIAFRSASPRCTGRMEMLMFGAMWCSKTLSEPGELSNESEWKGGKKRKAELRVKTRLTVAIAREKNISRKAHSRGPNRDRKVMVGISTPARVNVLLQR